MSRLPIRVRLTAAFALAMVLLLAGAGLFVYLRLEDELLDSIDEDLQHRAELVVTGGERGRVEAEAGAPAERDDGFAQVLTVEGRVVDSSQGLTVSVLAPAEAATAAARGLRLTREVGGVDDSARILGLPLRRARASDVVVVGQSLEDRNETLADLVAAFAVGGPIAVLLASILGYALASAGLRPVEAMRRRAGEISLEHAQQRLPLPEARDEIRRLGETLNEMLARLRESFARERRFVADASHELRTPITVIKAELEAALASGDLGAEARASVVAAIEECDNLAALAEDMLVLARAADGALSIRPERLDAAQLVAWVRARFERRARERGREIRVDAAPGIALEGDPLRIRQALGNLVDNALRHGGGDVVLTARGAGDAVELEVSDAGPGFDPEFAATAFDRFTRADSARSGGGAGLGLAIVRAVCEAHGGRAEIVPRETGATVRIRLPSAGASSG